MRKTLLIIGITSFAVAACVVIPFLIWSPGQILGMYKIEDLVEVPSPDGRYIASGYHVWGSAVVHDSTIFNIRPKNDWFNSKENEALLVVDMTGPNNPFNISWTNNKELVVTYTPGSIYLQKFNWKDVAIKYIEK